MNRGHKIAIGIVRKVRGKAGSHNRRHRLVTLQQLVNARKTIDHHFGALRAYPNTVPATNATLVNHLGLTLNDSNRLCRTLTHARVTDTTPFRHRVDRLKTILPLPLSLLRYLRFCHAAHVCFLFVNYFTNIVRSAQRQGQCSFVQHVNEMVF